MSHRFIHFKSKYTPSTHAQRTYERYARRLEEEAHNGYTHSRHVFMHVITCISDTVTTIYKMSQIITSGEQMNEAEREATNTVAALSFYSSIHSLSRSHSLTFSQMS